MNRIDLERVSSERNVIVLVKDGGNWAFVFDDASRSAMLRQIGKMASNQDLSFTWWDAAVVAQKIRTQSKSA